MSRLLRSNITVASGTALSRATGVLRVFALGYVLGQTALSDAYQLANETPNIVYELLIGGVLSATLVPLFSTFDEDDDEDSTNVVLSVAVILMGVLTVLAVLAAPLVFGLYSLNVEGVDTELFRRVGTTLARIFLIQIFFYGLVGLMNAFLNSRRRFFAAAWSPVVPNLIIIGTLLSLPGAGSRSWALDEVLTDDRLRLTLGLGATLGIASMALFLVPAARATGFRFRFRPQFRHPAVRRLLTLSVWTIGFVVANQAALIVVRNVSQPGSSLSSAYFAAFIFFMLPHGLLGVSIATTFQPEMARAVARRDKQSFISQASLGVRMTALLTIPAGVGLFVLRRPVVGAFLQHGNFDVVDARNTARALAGLALGLGAFSVYLFVLRGFYAHKDTRTAFVVNVVENGINIALAFVLWDLYGVLGLGLAFALAYIVASAWTLQIMTYKVPGFPLRDILGSVARMLIAAALMGEVVWLVAREVGGVVGIDAAIRLAVGTVVGIVVYFGLLAAMGAPELDALPGRGNAARLATTTPTPTAEATDPPGL